MYTNKKYNQVVKNLSRSMTALNQQDHFYDDVPADAPPPKPPSSPSAEVHHNPSNQNQIYVNVNRTSNDHPNYTIPDKRKHKHHRYSNEQISAVSPRDVESDRPENYDTFDPNYCPRHHHNQSAFAKKFPKLSGFVSSNPWRVATIALLIVLIVLMGLVLNYAINRPGMSEQSGSTGKELTTINPTTSSIPRLIP